MQRSAAIEAEFKNLFDREYEQLCRYAYTYMQDEHLAEDVVQDTFIKIWEQKKDLITSENIKFYLVTAVRNNCISALRKQQTSKTSFTDNTPEPEPEPFLTDRQHRENETEQVRKIREALDQLPPKCKEVFLMIKMHGMSYKQAADSLNLSVKTIENQMGKAIKILRELVVTSSALSFIVFLLRFIPGIGVFILFSVFIKETF